MLRKISFLFVTLFFIFGCSIGKINNKVPISSIPNIKQSLDIQKKLSNPNIDKYFFSEKQYIIEKLKLLHELEKNKEYEKADILKEEIYSDVELLSLRADISDMEEKERKYKKDLEIYGNNSVLDELDEILKDKEDENVTGVKE